MADLPSRVDALERGLLWVAKLSVATAKGQMAHKQSEAPRRARVRRGAAGWFFVLLPALFASVYSTYSGSGKKGPQLHVQHKVGGFPKHVF